MATVVNLQPDVRMDAFGRAIESVGSSVANALSRRRAEQRIQQGMTMFAEQLGLPAEAVGEAVAGGAPPGLVIQSLMMENQRRREEENSQRLRSAIEEAGGDLGAALPAIFGSFDNPGDAFSAYMGLERLELQREGNELRRREAGAAAARAQQDAQFRREQLDLRRDELDLQERLGFARINAQDSRMSQADRERDIIARDTFNRPYNQLSEEEQRQVTRIRTRLTPSIERELIEATDPQSNPAAVGLPDEQLAQVRRDAATQGNPVEAPNAARQDIMALQGSRIISPEFIQDTVIDENGRVRSEEDILGEIYREIGEQGTRMGLLTDDLIALAESAIRVANAREGMNIPILSGVDASRLLAEGAQRVGRGN